MILLILTLTFNGETTQIYAGSMTDQQFCVMAGIGITTILEDAMPGLDATYNCFALEGENV